VSETSKYRHLTAPYCQGNGVDIGSGGDPVVPWAIQLDLPDKEYQKYHSGQVIPRQIQWRGSCIELPFKDSVLDFVYSSHLIEDFTDWDQLLIEWLRVLKPEGHLVILAPDKDLWGGALQRGQPANRAHKHEAYPGEFTECVQRIALVKVIEDRRTCCFPGDYTILFVAQKICLGIGNKQ